MKKCLTCKALQGQLHQWGCEGEQCPACGLQLISCMCYESSIWDHCWENRRIPWKGEWPGLAECRTYGFWHRNITPYQFEPCDPAAEGAREDLNRLVTTCDWDSKAQKFIQKDKNESRSDKENMAYIKGEFITPSRNTKDTSRMDYGR